MSESDATRLVGIDLGGTSIKAGAVSAQGEILARGSAATRLDEGASAVLDAIAKLARELGVGTQLGVGTPGLIDRERGVLLEAPNLHVLQGSALRNEIATRLAIDASGVVLENDANVAALGEHWLGVGRDEPDLLVVTLGTGIGGGLILGGELFVGPGGMAGEIGHVVVDPDGPVCGCGARGCVETLASASAAARRARALGLPDDRPGDLALLAARARFHAGAERDLCFAIGRDLGRALGTVVSLLDLRTFAIGGGFGAALDVLESGVRAGLAERAYGNRLASVKLLAAELGADAGWIGAARLTLRR